MTTLGILHPGTMGSALGACAARGGAKVIWASRGRSAASAARARRAGAVDVGILDALCSQSDVVMAICPPAAAETVARGVAATGFSGTYVDANAISPQRAHAIAHLFDATGADVVDAAVLGPPPWEPGTTRLYLAGQRAGDIGAVFAEGPVDPVVLREPFGSASAVKMAYSSAKKAALALTALSMAMAAHYNVGHLVTAEWERDEPGDTHIASRRIGIAAPKAWRWVGEMQEIGDSALGAGLPDGFHRAAAEVFNRWHDHRDPEGNRSAVVEDIALLLRELAQESARASG